MNVILGAGISGLSTCYHLGLSGKNAIIYEKENSWGGLCDNFKIKGFLFDIGIHLSFSNNIYINELFSKSCDYYEIIPDIGNYYYGYWLKHPAQNNLYPLPVDQKVKIIRDFAREKKVKFYKKDYESWLKYHFGNYFALNFPMRYSRKYWTIEAKELTVEWIKNRIYRSSLDELLKGAMTTDTPNVYYAGTMRYPKVGGYKSFLRIMADQCQIALNKEAISIDINKKKVEFKDGSIVYYENLISSLPLPELIKIIKDVPCDVLECANKLAATSVALISLGLKSLNIPNYLWIYIYDDDIFPARVYQPNLKSPNNVPNGYNSLQFEIYFSKFKKLSKEKDDLIQHVIKKSQKINLFDEKDIIFTNYREIKYANVIFDKSLKKNRLVLHNYLDRCNIRYVGRFGEWDYLWSDECLLSGMLAAR